MADIHRLAAVLAAGNGSDNLRHNRAGNLEAFWAFNQLAVHNGAIVQHVADVNQAAVKNRLDEIISIMEMDCALVMRLGNFFRQDNAAGQILGNLTGNQIALGRSHNGVFVGVFLHNVLIAVAD